jgi:hypothetical protein
MAADPLMIAAPSSPEPTRRAPDVQTGGSAPTPLRRRRVVSAIPASLRHSLIEEAAYRRAEARAFAPGHELDDWLAAEAEVDAVIRERYR